MRRNEAGYATVTAAGMLAGLSILGISFMNLSSATLSISDQRATTLLLDGALEEQLADTVTKLANGNHKPEDFPLEGQLSSPAIPFRIVVESERNKLALNQATKADLSSVLDELGVEAPLSHSLVDRFRAEPGMSERGITLDEILPPESQKHLRSCLRSRITEFNIPPVFTRRGEQKSLDGEILRVKVESNRMGASNRGLETSILFTGDRIDPVWTLDWLRYSIVEEEVCSK